MEDDYGERRWQSVELTIIQLTLHLSNFPTLNYGSKAPKSYLAIIESGAKIHNDTTKMSIMLPKATKLMVQNVLQLLRFSAGRIANPLFLCRPDCPTTAGLYGPLSCRPKEILNKSI